MDSFRPTSMLPETTEQMVLQCRAEVEAALVDSTTKELQSAEFRLVWALVHSSKPIDIEEGLQLAHRLQEIPIDRPDEMSERELRYLVAVGLFKTRQNTAARRILKKLLQETPGFRQADSLLAEVEEALIREGLLGVGLVGAVAAVAGFAIYALAKR